MVHPITDANEKSPFGELTPSEFYTHHSVTHSSKYITNARGLKLFTQWWIPILSPPQKLLGSVFVIHGFACESSWILQLTAVHLAKAGFIICAIDHQGHGFSEGLDKFTAHIPDINPVVDDCISFFQSFRKIHAPPPMPAFLYGESLGGAIALLMALKNHSQTLPFDGVVLSGAMCEVSAKFKPPWPLEHLLWIAATLFPRWRIIPTRMSMYDGSFKIEWKRKLAKASPNAYKGRPRAATAYELLRICRELQGKFEKVDVPLLILHGEKDVLCDPEYARKLHQQASSKDKTLKIYPGMGHLLVGESDKDVELVFSDVLNWLKTRALHSSRL